MRIVGTVVPGMPCPILRRAPGGGCVCVAAPDPRGPAQARSVLGTGSAATLRIFFQALGEGFPIRHTVWCAVCVCGAATSMPAQLR